MVKSAAKESLYCTQRNPGERHSFSKCGASQHFETVSPLLSGTKVGVMFESVLLSPPCLWFSWVRGHENLEMSPQPAGSGLPPFVSCAVSYCLCLYLLEHNPKVTLNVWGVTLG